MNLINQVQGSGFFDEDLFIIDKDYYNAFQLLSSAEYQLLNASRYLGKSSIILDSNCNVNWKYGYFTIYGFRCMDLSTAIIWYNNVMDSLFQMVFFAFGLYKHHRSFKSDMSHTKTLELCDYKSLSEIYSANKSGEFKQLWEILVKAYNSNTPINKLANRIKHQGGIKYIGIELERLYEMIIQKEDEQSKISDFDSERIDVDETIELLGKHHVLLLEVIKELVNFINFYDARFIESDNKRVCPDKSSYCKLIL